jgi:phosphoglycerate dehydrogenase-like enzyme
VVSAWAANGVSVAEFCLAQILLACKGYFRNTRDCRDPHTRQQQRPFHGPGVYGETVAVIGAGQIGRNLIRLLKPFRLRIAVVDPTLSEPEADALNVTRVSMEDAFARAFVVSNHLPNLPELQRVLDGRLFESMRQDATFINTGRGAQVNEAELVDVLRRRPDLMALLDVTDPEPPPPGSPLYTLPNVQLSSHLAGAHDDEVVRMADTVIEEFARWRNGEPLRHAVSPDMLDRLA